MNEQIEQLLKTYRSLELSKIINFDKFNHFAIVHHSSNIEGSTLTEIETQLLLDEGLTPKGKPIQHSLMEVDHYQALPYVLEFAKEQTKLKTKHIQHINALTQKNTGQFVHTAQGTVDGRKGEFRKSQVSAGGNYFVNFQKIAPLMQKLIDKINDSFSVAEDKSNIFKLELAFTTHFDLVIIHPFMDGNGRTSRLLMNLIQAKYTLPLSIVYKEDKADYYNALQETRHKNDINVFFGFMKSQYVKQLSMEIEKAKQLDNELNQNREKNYSFIF